MSVHQLPRELLDAIASHLSRKSLVALSVTASPFLCVAQRILYRHLSISLISPNFSLVPLLASRPSLARHVHYLDIRLQSFDLLYPFYRLLALALSHMQQLTSLDLFIDPQASWVLSSSESVSYPRLLHFSSSFPLDSNVAAFLAKANALHQLELADASHYTDPPVPLPSLSVPQLAQFSGSSRIANVIVPGRPVQTIHLLSGDVIERDIFDLANSTASVIILDAETSCSPIAFLNTLAHAMPYLEYLRVVSTNHLVPPTDFMTKAVNRLPHLRAFEFCGIRWDHPGKFLPREETTSMSHTLTAVHHIPVDPLFYT